MPQDQGWLQISTEGFAALNQSRPPGHLVKELVQNAFDAVGEEPGVVKLDYRASMGSLTVRCEDTGSGIEDLDALRVVYLTHKTDSHLKRGRFGRGFKEILSIARRASVESDGDRIEFLYEDGNQVIRRSSSRLWRMRTAVEMEFEWPSEAIQEFEDYFARFLPPGDVKFLVNGRRVKGRTARHEVEASLPTEVFDQRSQSWKKPTRRTTIKLTPISPGDTPFLYEMGIPVASAEWTAPFHIDVQQRVPMNPNRDAFASGFAVRVHGECLPILVDAMSPEEATADWVGAAGRRCDAHIQEKIVRKAFGSDAVRSVPAMGKRDYDDDAQRIGAPIVHTGQMSTGFREMAKEHLPTAKDLVLQTEARRTEEIEQRRFSVRAAMSVNDERRQWILRRGGTERVNERVNFAVWFCQKLLDSCGERQSPVTGSVALGTLPFDRGPLGGEFQASWSAKNELTLALEVDCLWEDPLGAESLTILIHEAAHARNQHHGRSFNEEVERLAGVAANVMFIHADEVRTRWSGLME